MAEAATRCPGRRSPALDADHSYRRFSRASRRISATSSPGSGGRPGALGWRHFAAAIRRCQRSSVPGVTIMERAGFDRSEFFLTNIYVGLKDGSDARGDFPGALAPSFCNWCDDFLSDQIQLMQPRALVTLGGEAAEKFQLIGGRIEKRSQAGVDFMATALMHPSSGHLYKPRKGASEKWIDHEARLLRQVSAPR